MKHNWNTTSHRSRLLGGTARHIFRATIAIAICTLSPTATVLASQSNRNVGELSVETLPSDVPAFLRRPEAIVDTGVFAREPDRMRGAGPAYDAENVEDHYFKLDEAGRTPGGIKVTELPATRPEYAKSVYARNQTLASEGAVFYAVVEGWERLRRDFAYWRVATVAARAWKDPAQRAWASREVLRREWIIKRDIGSLAHFAQDATQPLHISIHNEGWHGDPSRNYTTRPFRRYVEGPFIKLFVSRDAVKSAMPPLKVCSDAINACVAAAMLNTLPLVDESYAMATKGAFDLDGPEATAFLAQLAGPPTAGEALSRHSPGTGPTSANAEGAAFMARIGGIQAAFTRDLVVKAWRESLDQTINYAPMVLSVREVEAGRVPTYAHLLGWD